MTKIAVVIPSVGRSAELAKCLHAITQKQELDADIVIVVTQIGDIATVKVAKDFGTTVSYVPQRGLAQAVETGLGAAADAGAEIACFTDDDAVPRPNWVRGIALTFSGRPSVGIVCGRDNINGVQPEERDSNPMVGLIRRGRIVGNHHAGRGSARPVDHAKGANMALRVAPAIAVPLAAMVYGEGAQAGNELILSMALKSKGFSCIYDPNIEVDHYPGVRPPTDDRFQFSREKTFERSYNRAFGVIRFAGWQTCASYLFRCATLGDRANPGLVAWLYWARVEGTSAWRKFAVTLDGTRKGAIVGLRERRAFIQTQRSSKTR